MLKQYDEWYKSIKKSIGFKTEEYNESQDTLRQLAKKNNCPIIFRVNSNSFISF